MRNFDSRSVGRSLTEVSEDGGQHHRTGQRESKGEGYENPSHRQT